MRKVVISQPMLFPWVGLFEQIRLADVFVYYDDVQFSKGSFVNRVQIKHESGFKWMTIPLSGQSSEMRINEAEVDERKDWRNAHIAFLRQSYARAPYIDDLLSIVDDVYSLETNNLCEIVKKSMDKVCEYFQLTIGKTIVESSKLNIGGSNTERVLHIVQHFNGSEYITGHGAKNYLDHQSFEDEGIAVEYMDYLRRPYPQLYGSFNPHVSILDLIANVGAKGIEWIISGTKNWKEAVNETNR